MARATTQKPDAPDTGSEQQQLIAQQLLGDIAPKLNELAGDMLAPSDPQR